MPNFCRIAQLAKEVSSIIESAFPVRSVVLAQEIIPSRVVILEDGMNSIFEAHHEHSLDSAYLGYFQVGPDHPLRNVVLTRLFVRIVSDKCFKTLRTDEQLGHLVGCKCSEHSGIMSFVVWVQSARNPLYVNSRVKAFLRQLKQILIEISPVEYETNKSSLRNSYSRKILSQMDMLNAFWDEIATRRYLFEWKEENIAQLDPPQKEDIIEFYETYIAESSSKRRKIDIHITSNITNPPAPDDESIEKSVKIEDSSTFPFELLAYPQIVSYRDVALPGVPVPL